MSLAQQFYRYYTLLTALIDVQLSRYVISNIRIHVVESRTQQHFQFTDILRALARGQVGACSSFEHTLCAGGDAPISLSVVMDPRFVSSSRGELPRYLIDITNWDGRGFGTSVDTARDVTVCGALCPELPPLALRM